MLSIKIRQKKKDLGKLNFISALNSNHGINLNKFTCSLDNIRSNKLK